MEEAERLCDRVAIIEHGRLIEVGTPDELVRKHCPERAVVFTSDDANVAERMQRLGAVERAEGSEATYTIRGEGDDFVTDVINLIAREGIRVRGFRTEIPTLEDVFLKLTGHGIQGLTMPLPVSCAGSGSSPGWRPRSSPASRWDSSGRS